MCRIAGILSNTLSTDAVREKVMVMCLAQQHGGPDDEGIFVAEHANLVFGHRRLAIIDLSTRGHQPMADTAKKTWITFNGEIYNYLILKEELVKAGARFDSDTDTEVILQVYQYWGIAGFARLRGMFAFALYDIEKAFTYLVRDPMGIKPLYYHTEGEQLSFSSEVRALKLAGIANETNPAWLIKFLAYGHVPEPDTTLKNVYSLPKGHLLGWDIKKSTYTISSYTVKPTISYITDINVVKSSIKEYLTAAITRQLIADAPIGVFLSGGTDSTLLTLLANQHKQQQLKTVSLFFNEKEYDESAYQQQVRDQIQGEKFAHLIKQQDFEESFAEIINAMDMPTTDGVNTWFISKYARINGLKAVLSGIGADELFGGYPSFKRIKYIKYLSALPSYLLKMTNTVIGDRFKKTSYLTHKHPLADYLFLRGLFAPEEIAEILNCEEKEIYTTLFSSEGMLDPGRHEQQRASWYESNLYMQNQLLRDTDVMSMRNGLEVRIPFLDEDFQHMVDRISPEIRFDLHQPKKILIDSFQDILPSTVWDRPKMGFSFPLQKWMKHHEAIGNEDSYHNKTAKSIIRKFNDDKVHWSKAFALYQVQKDA
jgi:asparagine synthase (glutamine-hydrolysing)